MELEKVTVGRSQVGRLLTVEEKVTKDASWARGRELCSN